MKTMKTMMSVTADTHHVPNMRLRPPTFSFKDSEPSIRTNKRQRRTLPLPSDCDMAFYAPAPTQYLAPTSSLARKERQHSTSRNDLEDYVDTDLELSFASNVSISSPQRTTSGLPDTDAMDISPMPKAKVASGIFASSKGLPRSRTLAAQNCRLFGSDLSNTSAKVSGPAPAKTDTTANRKLARSALPLEWTAAVRPAPEPLAPQTEPSSPMDDAMDVDTSYIMEAPPPISPTDTKEDGFSNLFFDTLSPRRSLDSPRGPTKKRRSLSPPGSPAMHHHEEASSPMPPSPSVAKLDRMVAAGRASKPSLQGLGAPSAAFLRKPRRPVLSEMVQSTGIQSAYPILSAGPDGEGGSNDTRGAPVRRAFSAMLPPSFQMGGAESEGDSSFDACDMSSPAQAYSKRQQGKTLRRCDGTEDFRPLTAAPLPGVTAALAKESPSRRFMSPGLPGFGDNEAHGKILPCHRVTEDGLMRITPQTLDNLLDGKFDNCIRDFHIIDCRFDYEYNGGHIKGAVNINTTAAVEELLLGPSLTKPKPSVSGDSNRKTILVFHCEFSAKRAPTFAKHLRAKDRAMNNHNYPKIHYPEVYILEGGYCNYFKTAGGHRCDPPAYVTMDDPLHATARREDLDQFRKAKFGRHKSYAYGDGPLKASSSSQQTLAPPTKRQTAPISLFAAAASASRSRRSGSVSLMTLQENGRAGEGEHDHDHDDTDTDLGDSPCPPSNKAAFTLKGRPLGRVLMRAETHNVLRMGY